MSLEEARAADAALTEIDWSLPPAGARMFRFDAPSGALAAWEIGDPDGDRVVLVPGATGSKEDFKLLAEILASDGYFVQSYDIAGQYESADAGPAGPDAWTYDLFVDDMTAFLEAGAPANLLGFSFAGIVAQMVALARPELVRSLTLLATPPLAGQVFRRVRIVGWLTRLPFFTSRIGGGVLLWNVRTNFSKVTPERLAFANARLALTRRESVDGIIGLMMRTPDLRVRLRDRALPVLVAAGTKDLWRARTYRRHAKRMGAENAILATGHSPCETTPHELAFHMRSLFARVPDAAAEPAR
ncbi:alpha/beta hydrolase [Gryllotalpicola sp.]|uniref:alpha/beta fold hydrolase n=1 Tax=Gryllotalpicola sp. TaxID=1932787 RepID=UPI0026372029|nr:alpha/beta hydrolase [Gryllotalpicola sp.]